MALPEHTQNQLAVLQGQAEPKDESPEGLLAAEHLLSRYDNELTTAFNLVAQLTGEEERQATTRRKRSLVALAIVAVLVVAGLGGFFHFRGALADKQEQCPKSSDCADDGRCQAAIRWYPPPVVVECVAATDADCQASRDCRNLGRCRVQEGRCAALKDEDCRSTERCRVDGWCTARDGGCVATKVEDCRATKGCKERGACTPVEDVCVPGSDEDCQKSELCRSRGACREVENRCVSLPDGFDK